MRTFEEARERSETLLRLETWWNETGNPLFIWEAISRCLHADSPDEALPDFCREYLKGAAKNMTLLAWHRDFRQSASMKINSKEANELVPIALGLKGGRGTKNSFKELSDIGGTIQAALDEEHWGFQEAKRRIMEKHNVEEDQAANLIAKGRRMLGLLKPKGRPPNPKKNS